jgi:predicted ATPase
MSLAGDEKRVIGDLLQETLRARAFPRYEEYRATRRPDWPSLDQLAGRGLIHGIPGQRYMLTLQALRECGSDRAMVELRGAAFWLGFLQGLYRDKPDKSWTVTQLVEMSRDFSAREIARQLTYLAQLSLMSIGAVDSETGFVAAFTLAERILEVRPDDITGASVAALRGWAELPATARLDLSEICIDGYRPFREFSAQVRNPTVIIGANASGKSSLIDFLRMVQRFVRAPIPPEIDQRWIGQQIFHVGGPAKIGFALTFAADQPQVLRYTGEVHGPVGRVKVAREWLGLVPTTGAPAEPFALMDFAGSGGTVRSLQDAGMPRSQWTVSPNGLALERARDPGLGIATRLRDTIDSWRFFSGFDVSANAQIRRPGMSDEHARLEETGDNLCAVLLRMLMGHGDEWQEFSTHVRSVVPGFGSLDVKPSGKGVFIGIWRDEGSDGELTLGDLSDGTLRFLCWAALCLAPDPPPLICIDEPEVGLHPRVLPVLAGLLRALSARTQVLVATHSPHLLSQFQLDEVAVMRKDKRRAEFVRPASSSALRTMVEEIGGDALAELFVSDELETVP